MSTVQYTTQSQSLENINGDPIAQLPVDQSTPNQSETQIINTLFKKNRKTMDVIFTELKDSFIVGILVVLVCLPQIDIIINKILPITTKSPYFLLLIKAIIAIALFWIIKHFYLSRKSN